MIERLQALLSRKFLVSLGAVLLITFGVDADPEWQAAADAVVAAVFAVSQAIQNSQQPKD